MDLDRHAEGERASSGSSRKASPADFRLAPADATQYSLCSVPPTLLDASASAVTLDLTGTWIGYAVLAIFVLAYVLVVLEERLRIPKSKPVLMAAGILWVLVAAAELAELGTASRIEVAARHNLLEYAELLLFLLVAMTYVNALEERRVFDALRAWMVRRGYSLRRIYWVTGGLAFIISPVADNMTTAMLMCAVVMAVGGKSARFVSLACINVVVAANAGGAFSPFGDITTLMVWQKGMLGIWSFLWLLPSALISWLIPAAAMSVVVGRRKPPPLEEHVVIKRGGLRIVALFLLTLVTAVVFHTALHLPPVLGMMTGLGYLGLFGYFLKQTYDRRYIAAKYGLTEDEVERNERLGSIVPFDVFGNVARAEWDTLLFFYGVVMCVGALGHIGYLGALSHLMYDGLGPMAANIGVGLVSAVVDNIPVMFAVLSMEPSMDEGQWLLVTLTAGIGGSLLSIGSAAGVALMGQSKGKYTFWRHLRWTPFIALGYAAAIGCHLLIDHLH